MSGSDIGPGATLEALHGFSDAAALADEASRYLEAVELFRADSRQTLFVIPSERGDGFRASIRGHVLELADPDSGHGLAPTPDDLLAASIASDLAWFARRFLRDRGLDDYVSVAAWSRTNGGPTSADGVDVAITVRQAPAVRTTLSTALESEFAGKFPDGRLQFQVCAE